MPMHTGYSGDPRDADKIITDTIAERRGRPLRIRLQPQILRPAKGRGEGQGQYVTWKDTVWTVECDTAPEAFALRTAMRAFFAALGRGGPDAVVAALEPVGKEAVA